MSEQENYNGFGRRTDGLDDYSGTEFLVEQMLNQVATATLVLVKKVDASKGIVDVQPMVSRVDGAGQASDHGIINAMPYLTLRAGSAALIATPKVGDIGIAIFCHSDTSSVRKTKKPSPPGSRRRFDWADGFYLGGFLGPTPTTLISVDDGTGVTITVPSGKSITMNGNVTINGTLTATTDVVGGGKSLKSHTHSGVTTGSGTSGPPS